MVFNSTKYSENLFDFDASGLDGSEIADKINELAQEYRFNDAEDVFLEVIFRNDEKNAEKREYIKYDRQTLADFVYAYDHPEEIWYMQQIQMGSDTRLQLFEESRKDLPQRLFEIKKIIFRGPEGLYDELMDRIRPEEEQESQTRYWLRQKPRRRAGFFPYVLDSSYLSSNEDEAVWLREEMFRIKVLGEAKQDWVHDYQLLVFSSPEDIKALLSELDEDAKGNKEDHAIKDECFSTPCILWALKPYLTAEEYEEFWHSQSIFGTKTRINEVTKFLKKHEYNYVFLKETPRNKTRYQNKNWTKQVKIQYVGDHWMRPCTIEIKINGHLQRMKLNIFLQRCIDKKLFRHMSAYELATLYNNFSYAAYGFLNKSIDEVFDSVPINQLTLAPKSWYKSIREKPFNPDKEFPKIVIFFDFEADTSGAFHRPFLVSACEVRLKEDGSYLSIGEIQSFWGAKCAEDFMKWVYSRIYVVTPSTLNKKYEKTIRLYAYNARYDLTFILPYLHKTNVCMRANKFYSIEGYYINDPKKKQTKFEIWDAYLLFATSLKNAAKSTTEGGYLKPEQAKDIKKEMFPYNAYTFKYFEEHKDPWVSVEDMKVGFMEQDQKGHLYLNEAKYQEFLLTLKQSLPFMPSYYRRTEDNDFLEFHEYWGYRSKLYSQSFVNNGDVVFSCTAHFNYIEYAKFYCEQDVRCLTQIMLNMEDICMGRDTEGIQGTVPFKIHIWNHRTASSIGYDNLLMNAVYQYDEATEQWTPRHDFYFLQNEGRALMQKSIRGGRVMTAQNKVWEFTAKDEDYLQDCDANSLYPSTMAKILWLTDGVPSLLKGDFTEKDFQTRFTHPWATREPGEEKLFNDGIIHITVLHTNKQLDIPRLCVKDPKTKLNEWRNYDYEYVDTWVNAKDAWDLIDHQDAVFSWDKAMGFCGKRWYELQDCMRNLYAFRKPNKKLGVGNVAKLMMNSSYGKSTMKICDEEVRIMDDHEFPAFFKANAYRIRSFEKLAAPSSLLRDKYLVKIYKKDTSDAFNMFGSDVLAGSKCIMQRFTSIVEEIAEERKIHPHIYYTDTDSNHILDSLVNAAREKYMGKYGENPIGNEIGQFHNDFDVPKNFKKGEGVKGADHSFFLAKKVYCDHLLGDQGSNGYHTRMKGVPGSEIKPEDYKELYDGKTIHYNLLAGGKVSFAYEGGQIISREKMTRDIAIKRTRTEIEDDDDDDEPTAKLPRTNAVISPQY